MATPDGTRCAGCQTPMPATTGRGRPRKFCPACRPARGKSYTPTPPRETTCEQCSVRFLAKRTTARFCSMRCLNLAKSQRLREVVVCKNCGDEFTRAAVGGGRRQVYCCKHCMAVARSRRCVDCTVRAVAPGTTRCEPCAARSRWEREMARLIGKWLMRPASTAKPPRSTVCEHCGATFKTPQPMQRFCSRPCSKRHNRHGARARRRERLKNQQGSETVYRRRIAERDGWRCKLCGSKVRREAKVPHPLAPTLDHIVPIALGGKHEPSNVQLAHFMCNALKGAGARNEQLMLIG